MGRSWSPYVQAYLATQPKYWDRNQDWRDCRLVVLDTETTGLSLKTDQIISIGAVAIQKGEIVLGDSLEMTLKHTAPTNPEAATIHGLTAKDAATGIPEEQAMRYFLEYLGGDILVAHHLAFDYEMLQSWLQRELDPNFQLFNPGIDTAKIAQRLEVPLGKQEHIRARDYTLDQLCLRYHIEMPDRHTAWGDAYITAQLLLKLMSNWSARKPVTLGSLGL